MHDNNIQQNLNKRNSKGNFGGGRMDIGFENELLKLLEEEQELTNNVKEVIKILGFG